MPERRAATPEELQVLGSAVRLRIIRLTHHRPLTNKEIAEKVGKDPATTLHHVRKLHAAGFLEALPERRGTRGAKEIPYRSTGLSWRLSLGHTPTVSEAMLQAYLGEVAAAGVGAVEQTRLVVQVDEASRAELQVRIGELLEEFAGREPLEGAERTAVYLAIYPSG
ncbi:ArsR family transcriptional regulator [Actinokineospora bangkokensis]|uniref:ArsR family transcriptional regulator n=1 Tax=Actinokineospora bangkokensis TaxID=1193682 RepID=A0A1Q9LT41_9PSEU|nr:winged helix-turn-helix domain-containing protein [Actinokineospora bangkokensis]OLR95205.1 ArsR family transcriptional regulator [Actinokineospora bangkokensis]